MHYRLFIIILPGLEDLALKEIDSKCPISGIHKIKGGIEVEADLEWIVRAHTELKIPTRILLRVTEFKVRDFPKLHQKISGFKWKDVLSHPHPEFQISCQKSRLMHTGRIEETIQKGLKDALIKQPLSLDWEKKNYPAQTFYIRIVEDLLTLSLDLTGEPLYKRGLQEIKGEAPIRENIAAALLLELSEGLEHPVTLVDPMCGSGTFLSEAKYFYTPLHLRPFSFETAPFFKGKLVKIHNSQKSLPFNQYIGFDINEDLINKVKDKLQLNLNFQDSLLTKLNIPENFLMICNPPYGERIKIKGKRGSFLKEAWMKFLETDRPLRFGWIIPSDMDDLYVNPKGYKLKSKRHLKNGGLSVTFWIWEKIL